MCKQILLIERCTDSFCTVSWNLWNKESTSGYPVCGNVPWTSPFRSHWFLTWIISVFNGPFWDFLSFCKHSCRAVWIHLLFIVNLWNSDFYTLNFVLGRIGICQEVLPFFFFALQNDPHNKSSYCLSTYTVITVSLAMFPMLYMTYSYWYHKWGIVPLNPLHLFHPVTVLLNLRSLTSVSLCWL